MSKTKTYLYTLALVVVVIAVGFIMNITPIKTFCLMCFNFAEQTALSVTAAVCAFIFLGNKNYWPIIVGCAVMTALVIQFVLIGHNADMLTWAARISTFVAIVFVMNFVRLLVNR